VDCQAARAYLLDAHAGRLAPDLAAAWHAHVNTCPACAHEDAVEQALTESLERRLPQYPASLALKRRLATQWPAESSRRQGWGPRWRWWLMPAAVALLVLLTVPAYFSRRDAGSDRVVDEVVSDHLRILQPERRLGVESGGIHQVKPWFAGRLDFAPVVTFEGDADFPLKGGTVEYLGDRRAAVFVYGRRLHTISLLVFPADGVPLPARGTKLINTRGFTVLLWRAGDLGYALVSDVDRGELRTLAGRLSAPL